MGSDERRRNERFYVEFPADIAVQTPLPGQKGCHATTRDISTSGAFLNTHVRYPVGMELMIELTIALKDVERFPLRGTARVALKGSIIRAEPEGLAVEFTEHYEMRHIGLAPPA